MQLRFVPCCSRLPKSEKSPNHFRCLKLSVLTMGSINQTKNNVFGKSVSIQGRISGPARRSTKGGWTDEEDRMLTDAVERFNGKNWKMIAECVPYRSDVQCLHRWQKVLNPNLIKGPWTKEEDDLIFELVGKQGMKKWSQIAKYLPGRIGKQCRERWYNHLNPNIKRTAWSKEEELVLVRANQTYENRWAEIAKLLPGRTENSIKNHWNCSMRKKLELLAASGVYYGNHKEKMDCMPFRIGQSFEQTVNQGRTLHPSSKVLVHGDINARESNPASSLQENCRVMRKGDNGVLLQSSRRYDDLSNLTIKQQEVHAHDAPAHGETANIAVHCPDKYSQYSHERTKHGLPSRRLSGTEPFSPRTPLNSVTAAAAPCDRKTAVGGPTNSCVRPRDKNGGKSENVEVKLGCLSYETLRMKDLNVYLDTGKFRDTDSYIQPQSTPVSLDTSSVKISSPESILRTAAKSFKNTPSIIRRRNFQTSTQTNNDIESDGLGLKSAAMKSVEKRLEYAFDEVQDSTR